jgi:hypothetical protein
MTLVMYQMVSRAPRRGPEVSGYIQAVMVFLSGPWCADMEVNITGFRM